MPRLRNATKTGLLYGLLLMLAVGIGTPAICRSAPPTITGLGPQDALLVLDPAGGTVLTHNADQPMVPASTLKLLTSLAALHYLGPAHRFHTDFYLDPQGTLGIKGYGDPFLVSEVIATIARRLPATLPPRINGIVLDESYFAGPVTIPGVSVSTNPYDAPIGALCANFNTVFFTHANGRLVSAEEQTPLLPMVVPRIRRSGLKEGRIILSRRQNEAPLYAGHLFRYFLAQAGVETRGAVKMTASGLPEANHIYRHASPYDLLQVIQRLLEFSNNFTANQLLLAMGAECYGPPATLDKGVRALTAYAKEVIGIQSGVFVEGSGISRHNRLTVRDMTTVLDHFRPFVQLMPRKGQEYYKTGHLRGIRTRAGYIETGAGKLYRFALFRNQRGKTTAPVMRQVQRLITNKAP